MTNDDDKDLFRTQMINVKPLKPTKRILPASTKSLPKPKLLKQPKELLRHDVELNTEIDVPQIDATQSLFFKQPGVQTRQMRELQSGILLCQATLDLHGITVPQAEEELTEFLERTRTRGYRVVAIVHGKGHNSPDKYPALKNMVHRFLRQYPHSIGFCSAPPKLGGLGATLVLLKREMSI